MLKNPNLPLDQLFLERLNELVPFEKNLEKKFDKLSGSAYTPELSKCLCAESTDIIAHQKRIALILQQHKTKDPKIEKFPPFRTKKVSYAQDLLIIDYALNLQNQKLAMYEFLHPFAIAMNLQVPADLLAQTVTDTRNTNTWLRQIVQNIVVPQLNETG